MEDSFQLSLVATIFAAFVCPAASATIPEVPAEETLCIHLYNLAQLSPQTVAPATSRATRIFGRAGIRVRWEQPSADSPEAHLLDLNSSPVNLPRSGQSSCLAVRLVQDLPFNAYNGALGFAVPFARSGINAEIIYGRIESQARYAGIAVDVLLAYTMAHEIGHVLLGSSAHAAAGIMQAKWNAESWRLASFDMISFLPEQVEQMRQGLRRFQVEEPGLKAELKPVLAGNDCGSAR